MTCLEIVKDETKKAVNLDIDDELAKHICVKIANPNLTMATNISPPDEISYRKLIKDYWFNPAIETC